ncbi:MAG: delta-60 repeat domain-containing protein [Deltaproteobacteria bacterium]|nr:delta-60 repeat domain-containing protein [Deltaproteobacteria bacterium]
MEAHYSALVDPGKPFSSTTHLAARRLRAGLVFLLAFCLSLAFLSPALGGDGALDTSFDPGAGVKKIPIILGKVDYNDGSGKSLVYGYFTSIGGATRTSIARLNSDGGLDGSFNAVLNSGEIRDVALLNPSDPNSQILIGGVFSIGSGGNIYNNLALLSSSGSQLTGPSFYLTLGSYGAVNSLAVQSDGKILVGGYSIPVAGDISATYHLLRLNVNGTLDTFYPKLSAPGGYVLSLKILGGDTARLFGTIPRAGGSHMDYLLVLNATGVVQTNLGDETVDGPILNMGQQSGGKWVIGGQFGNAYNSSTASWVPRNRVARLNSNLTLDPSFSTGGPNGSVAQVTIQTDNKIVLAGNFSSFNGTPCGYLVRLSAEGVLDSSFNSGGSGADDRIFRMTDNGSLTAWYIFGAFRTYNGTNRPGIAYLSLDGTLTATYAGLTTDSTTLGTVYALARQSDGKILIGGDFTGYRGKYRGGFARLNPGGTLDTSFKGGIDGTYVKSIAIQPDGKILLAGYFGAVQQYACTSLARLNSDSYFDTTFKPIVTKLDGSVSDLKQVKPRQNGQIMVAGHFRTISGLSRTTAARLNADGTLDAAFDAQVTINLGVSIRSDRVAEVNGKYLVVGYVTYDGLSRGFLTRLTNTGAMDPTFGPTAAPTPSPNVIITAGEVKDLALQKDGRIMVCGDFVEIIDGSFSRPQRGRIARFTADGLLDGTFTTTTGANSYIEAMALQPNGKILIGGNFTGYNLPNVYPTPPPNRNRLARVLPNGDLDNSFNPGTGLAEPASASYKVSAYAVLRLASGKALIGGYFSQYNGTTRNQLAQVLAGPADACPAPVDLLLLD